MICKPCIELLGNGQPTFHLERVRNSAKYAFLSTRNIFDRKIYCGKVYVCMEVPVTFYLSDREIIFQAVNIFLLMFQSLNTIFAMLLNLLKAGILAAFSVPSWTPFAFTGWWINRGKTSNKEGSRLWQLLSSRWWRYKCRCFV